MRKVTGRIVGNFFAANSIVPKGTTYSIVEEIDLTTGTGIGKFFLANEQDLELTNLNAGGYVIAPANFELLMPYPIKELPQK